MTNLLRFEVDKLEIKLQKLAKALKQKVNDRVEIGAQSTENFMHDDAPQQIAVGEKRTIERQYDHVRKILKEYTLLANPKNDTKIMQGHIATCANGNIYKLVGYVFGGEAVQEIAVASPASKQILGKRVGDQINLGKTITIIRSIKFDQLS